MVQTPNISFIYMKGKILANRLLKKNINPHYLVTSQKYLLDNWGECFKILHELSSQAQYEDVCLQHSLCYRCCFMDVYIY